MVERADDFENEADGLEISDRLGSILAAELASHAEQMLKTSPTPKNAGSVSRKFCANSGIRGMKITTASAISCNVNAGNGKSSVRTRKT